MTVLSWLGNSYVTLTESMAETLSQPSKPFRTVEVHPPAETEPPATLDRFVDGITEYQTALLGLRNRSPIAAYEIRRVNPSRLRFQFAVPTTRLERKVRTHLTESVPEVGFEEGVDGLPVEDADTVGVGVLNLRRNDVYPLRTEFDRPPINSVATALHRHAMRDSRIIVQLLFRPVAGRPVRRRLWHHQASQESRGLRSEKVGVLPWTDRDATPLEKDQASRVDEKAGSPRFEVSIRILVIGAEEYTVSRVKEVSGGFNVFADPETRQSFRTTVVRGIRESPIVNRAKAVRDRSLSRPFQVSQGELAGLVSIPSREQQNIRYSHP